MKIHIKNILSQELANINSKDSLKYKLQFIIKQLFQNKWGSKTNGVYSKCYSNLLSIAKPLLYTCVCARACILVVRNYC